MPADLSLFALLIERLGSRITPISATKATLVDVSHSLEDLVLTDRLPAIIFTGFQESSHWRKETARYRELAGIAHQICIFAGGSLPRENDQRQIHVQLRGPAPLRQEWFLLVLTDRFAAVLCGRDLLAPTPSEGDRRFDTIWSFEPEIIAETLALLREVVAAERPDRLADLEAALRRFPPPQPDAAMVTRFTTRLIDVLMHQHDARLKMERALSHESRLRALGQVLSGVAHELNNPLQSILGFASLIVEDPGIDPTVADDAQHIIEASERAQGIVRDLLQLSRPALNAFVATDLAGLIRHTLVFVRADLHSHDIEIEIHAPPDLPPVMANPTRIQQLLINLLTNAIQTLAGRPQPRRIDLELSASTPDALVLVVRDNGPGIPPHLHERVFEPFFTTKPVGEGTGLGLSIVHTIVKEHAGQIQLQSGPAGGTAFVISLPTAHAAPAQGVATAPAQGRGLVLLIDDDPHVNALISRVLTRGGYTVHAAQNPNSAIDLTAQYTYDAIVCDLLMPGLSGIEIYERLSQRDPRLARRMLFVTGDATRPATRSFIERSGQPCLLKPFTTKQLLAMLEQLLAG